MAVTHAFPQVGAHSTEHAVHYRVWAPEHSRLEAVVYDPPPPEPAQPHRPHDWCVRRVVPLTKEANGCFVGEDAGGKAGDLYKYRIDGQEAQTYPDPASRFQPYGVHGPSQVTRPGGSHRWEHDRRWRCFNLADLVIYELHVGTFTSAGTYRAAIEKLGHLVELGVTAVEIMPLADFPGRWNWGYDGVALYAPARTYGTPDELRALVDALHGHGLSVILDAVYNHLGPDGNYLSCFSKDYFNPRHHTPWGDALNFDGPNAAAVRAFFVQNPIYWLEEFHVDGFRLDAIHAIVDDSSRHVLSEIAAAIHERGGFVAAEDERNEAKLATPEPLGGIGLDSLWADDFHHAVRVAITGERESYLEDFAGSADEVRTTLENGWYYRGQPTRRSGERRGTEPARLPTSAFVYCISNHDQVGNRAFGERLTEATTPAGYRAASALLCLAPYLPLLFMGQEWGASTPFLYFTDHHPDLGRLVTEGRRREFKGFAAFRDEAKVAEIPDPQSEMTFLASKLRWEELQHQSHRQTLALYQAALRLRREDPALRQRGRGHWDVVALSPEVSAVDYHGDRAGSGPEAVATEPAAGAGHASAPRTLVVFSLNEGAAATLPAAAAGTRWRRVFSTHDAAFGGEGRSAWQEESARDLRFEQPEVLVVRAEPA